MLRSIRSGVGIAALAAVLLAGCADTVGGTATVDAAALSVGGSATAPVTGPSVAGISTPDSPAPQTTGAPTASAQSPASTPGPVSSGTSSPETAPSPAPRTSTDSTPGAYPTTPGQYYKNPQTQASANLLEARRMASSLLVPTLIDPKYAKGANLSTVPLRGPSAMSILFTPPVPAVAQRAGMITGFSSARTDPAGNGMVVAAFEFSTAAQATAAVNALAAASAEKSTDKGKAVLKGLPTATGWYGSRTGGKSYMQVFVPQGRLVLYVYLDGSPAELSTPALQAGLAATVLRAQLGAMAKFVPTPPADLMKLLVDPAGMLARTLPNVGNDSTVLDGFYSASAQLHFDSDPVSAKALFAQAGVDAVANGRTSVYRAKDAAGATAVRDSFVASTQKAVSGMQSYTLSVDVPTAKCIQQALNSTYYCVGVQGRYAFEVGATSESDLNAAMIAQYDILKGF